MRELFTMWSSTRMVVLTAISAALYAASLVAFKFLSILPGVTELRPGVAFVILCAILFGPAGAWGAAIGNTIGDLAGGLGPGTLVGFFANLLFGLVPYKVYRAFGLEDATPRSAPDIAVFVAASAAGSGACAVMVGWGIQSLGLWPIAFKVLTNTILLTNVAICVILCPFLLRAIYPRVAALGLRYQDILDVPPSRLPPAIRVALGVVAVLAVAAAVALGDAREFGLLGPSAPSLNVLVGVPVAILVAACAAID